MNYGIVFDLHFRCVDQMDSASLVYTPLGIMSSPGVSSYDRFPTHSDSTF